MAANPKKGRGIAEDSEVHVIGWDYLEQKTKEGQHSEDEQDPKTLVGMNGEDKWHTAEIVP